MLSSGVYHQNVGRVHNVVFPARGTEGMPLSVDKSMLQPGLEQLNSCWIWRRVLERSACTPLMFSGGWVIAAGADGARHK